jgi:hypothetical protein
VRDASWCGVCQVEYADTYRLLLPRLSYRRPRRVVSSPRDSSTALARNSADGAGKTVHRPILPSKDVFPEKPDRFRTEKAHYQGEG